MIETTHNERERLQFSFIILTKIFLSKLYIINKFWRKLVKHSNTNFFSRLYIID